MLVPSTHSPKLKLMPFDIYAPPPEAHALSLQSQPLFDGGIAAQLNLATRSQHALPREPERAPQNCCHLPSCSGISRGPRYGTVGRDFATRNCPNRLFDP